MAGTELNKRQAYLNCVLPRQLEVPLVTFFRMRLVRIGGRNEFQARPELGPPPLEPFVSFCCERFPLKSTNWV